MVVAIALARRLFARRLAMLSLLVTGCGALVDSMPFSRISKTNPGLTEKCEGDRATLGVVAGAAKGSKHIAVEDQWQGVPTVRLRGLNCKKKGAVSQDSSGTPLGIVLVTQKQSPLAQ
jgi:hypothetical protein